MWVCASTSAGHHKGWNSKFSTTFTPRNVYVCGRTFSACAMDFQEDIWFGRVLVTWFCSLHLVGPLPLCCTSIGRLSFPSRSLSEVSRAESFQDHVWWSCFGPVFSAKILRVTLIRFLVPCALLCASHWGWGLQRANWHKPGPCALPWGWEWGPLRPCEK